MVRSDGRVSPINTALMQIWTLYTFTVPDWFIVFIRMARNVGDSKLQMKRTKRLRLRQGDDLLERLPRRPSQLNGGQSLAQFLRAKAGLEEDIVWCVHPRNNVTLATVNSSQSCDTGLGEDLGRAGSGRAIGRALKLGGHVDWNRRLLFVRTLLEQLRLRSGVSISRNSGGENNRFDSLNGGRHTFVDVASIRSFCRTWEELDDGFGDLILGSQDEPFLNIKVLHSKPFNNLVHVHAGPGDLINVISIVL